MAASSSLSHATSVVQRAVIALTLGAVVVAGVDVVLQSGVAEAAPATPQASPSTTAGATGDVLVNGFGDEKGYHLELGHGESGYTWSELAVIQPAGLDEQGWTGYQCLSGDGKYVAVAVLPTPVVNVPSARERGAFAYSVEVATGVVKPIAAGVGLMYYSPGCGLGDAATFTLSLGADDEATGLVTADLATGSVTQSVSVSGQVSSAVPTSAGVIGVAGGTLVSVPVTGQPSVIANVGGDAFDLHPAADGGVNFVTVSTDGSTSSVKHELAGALTTLGSGPRTAVRLFQGRGGRAVLAGATSTNRGALAGAGVGAVDAHALSSGTTAASLDGGAVLGNPTSGDSVDPLLLATRSGTVATNSRPTSSTGPVQLAPSYVPPGATAVLPPVIAAGVPQPRGDAAPAGQPTPTAPTAPAPGGGHASPAPPATSSPSPTPTTTTPTAPTTGAPTTQTPTASSAPATASAPATSSTPPSSSSAPATSTAAGTTHALYSGSTVSASSGLYSASTPVLVTPAANTTAAGATAAQTPVCAVPRLAANRQVMQPSPAQVNWASQMAEQGLLTGSSYTRAAGFANLGLAAYAPSSDFPPISLSHPSGDTWASVPRSVYAAIMAQESNWSQASWHAPRGIAGDPLIADYYGAAGDIVAINYAGADCGYGLGQVTTGMRSGDHTYSVNGQTKVAVDYQENIAAGLQILESTWNTLYADGIIANDGNPRYLENWYFAAWAYNSGIQPNGQYNSTGCTPGPTCTGPDGTWGLGWANNPANPNYLPARAPYLQATYADAAHPASWPYQERVMGWMARPLIRYSSNAYAGPTYQGGNTWLQIPGPNTFCTVAGNKCDPTTTNATTPDAGHCTLSDYECWWHTPATWVSSCSSSCAKSSYEVSSGSEPANPSPNPPTCTVDTSKVPSGSIIVDDQNGSNVNLQGCPSAALTTAGSFNYAYGTDANGNPVGAIDTHQLGTGLGGHILFSHTETGSNPALINTGTWTPTLPSLQYYTVKIHVPALGAQATNVIYTVNPGGGVAPWQIRVNQAWNSEQWVTIGTFAMQNGGNVVLTNQSATVNTSGRNYSNFDVAYDAVAFVPRGGSPGAPIGGPPTVQDAPRGSNPAWVQCGCVRRTAGDPVDTSTGYFGDSFTDLTTPGRGEALNLTRSYAEGTADPSGPNGASAVNGPFGYGWTYNYNLRATTNASTGAVTITQEDGSTVAFTSSSGTYSTTAPRYDATLSKSGTTYTYTRRGRDIFTFDTATGRLTSEQDLAGARASTAYKTSLTYDGTGQLSTITDPAGRTYTLTWTSGHITKLVDTAGRTVTYGYDGANNLTDVWGVGTVTRTGSTPSNEDHAQYSYNTAHLMTSMRSPKNYGGATGAVTAMTYDSSERVLTQTDPVGRATTFTYGPSSSPSLTAGQVLVTDPAGHKTLNTYAGGLLTSETAGYGTSVAGITTYTYDPITLGVSTVVDPAGHTTTYTYDDHGNRTSSSDPSGYTINYAYDAIGDLTQTIDANGLATVNVFDQAGHIATGSSTVNDGTVIFGDLTSITVTQANNVVESGTGNFGTAPTRTVNYYYDDAAHPGDPTRVVDQLGNTVTSTFDAAGDIVSVSDPLNRRTLHGWDMQRGWMTSTVLPAGAASGTTAGCSSPANGCITYGHDAWGNTTSITDPLGHISRAVFNANGEQTSTTDADGNTTTSAYDASGQNTQVNRPDGSHTSTTYNGDGTVATAVGPSGSVTSFGYDARGRQTTVTDPNNRTTTTGYDANSNVVTVKDAAGRTTSTSYDVDDRVISASYSDGVTPAVSSVAYDPMGVRIRMVDGTGTSTWSYDSFGELTNSTNGAGATVGYAYDNAGRPTTMTYPGSAGTVVNAFDAAGQLTSVTDPSGRKTNFGYSLNGANTSTTYPNGDVVTAGYNGADQQTSTTVTNGSSTLGVLTYGRDNAAQLTSQAPSGGLSGPSRTFTYDANQQIASASAGGTTSTYSYDGAANLSVNAGAGQSFDAAAQLCWSTTASAASGASCGTIPTGATRYSYDTDGNRTAKSPVSGGASTYGYDQQDRMTSFSGPAGAATYTYAGSGLRASKTVGSTTTNFVYSAGLLISDGSTYIYGPGGRPVEQISGGMPYYFIHDQIGSTVALLNNSGAICSTWVYDAFGKVASSTGTVSTPLLYGGGYMDQESGLIYLQARYYDPATGQFMTVDPMVAQTRSAYGYVLNNPLNDSDPTGLCGTWCWIGLGAAAVVIGIVTVSAGEPLVAAAAACIEAGCIEAAGGLATAAGAAAAAVSAASSRGGGVGPVNKGNAGMALSIQKALAGGATNPRTEITVQTPVGRTRIDLTVTNPDGSIGLIEAKNGPHARLNPNQRRVFDYIAQYGCTGVGANAAAAGLDHYIPPTQVQVDYWNR